MFIDPAAIERKLAAQTMLFSLAEAARTVGLSPDYITTADWRRLVSILLGLGWRQRSVDGEKVWLRGASIAADAARPRHRLTVDLFASQSHGIIMFETSATRNEAFVRIRDHLSSKTGPLRLERIAERIWGTPWAQMSYDDRFIIGGIMSRLGWQRVWPHWYRSDHLPGPADPKP